LEGEVRGKGGGEMGVEGWEVREEKAVVEVEEEEVFADLDEEGAGLSVLGG
jgi:hypothetical protein